MTRVWIASLVASSVSNLRALPMFTRWKLGDLTILETWAAIVILESNMTPRFLMGLDWTATSASARFMNKRSNLASWVLKPITNTSVLSAFNLRKLEAIQTFTLKHKPQILDTACETPSTVTGNSIFACHRHTSGILFHAYEWSRPVVACKSEITVDRVLI